MLTHNSYQVSLDGSRRVTQRTRAHLKSISIFPIRAGNGSSAAPPPRVFIEAPPVTDQIRSDVPGADPQSYKKMTPPLEPSSMPQDAAEHLQRPVELVVVPDVKPLLARALQPAAALAPPIHCWGTASAPQPLAGHPLEPSPVAPPIYVKEPRRRG